MLDVVAVLVNFNSGALCQSAVRSILAQRFPGRSGGAGRVHVVVVDNASPVEQRPLLEPLRALGVDVIFHDRNDGYGAGLNLGLARAPDSELVFVANPDILVLDGAFAALAGLMRGDPAIGAAGPRSYLDAGCFFMQPGIELPGLATDLLEALARRSPRLRRRLARSRTARSVRGWRAAAPVDAETLSGFALFLDGALARRLGPFDPAFPFYYEDADLCRRVRAAGRRLVFEPRARMVHFFDRSARSVRAEALHRYQLSRDRYFRKHYGALALTFLNAAWRLGAPRGAAAESAPDPACEDLGDLAEPPRLEFAGRERDYILEISVLPSFLYCGGHVGHGRVATIAATGWEMLEPTRWYCRVLAPEDLTVLRAVTFRKTAPCLPPTSFEELVRMGESGRHD